MIGWVKSVVVAQLVSGFVKRLGKHPHLNPPPSLRQAPARQGVVNIKLNTLYPPPLGGGVRGGGT